MPTFISSSLPRYRPTLAVAAAAFLLGACSPAAPPPPAPAEVTVMKVVAAPVTVNDQLVAQTEAVQTVEIRGRVGGIVEKQVFRDGTPVKTGDLLFVIDQRPYVAALNQAKANLAQAQANQVNSRQVLDRIKPLLQDQAVSQQDVDAAVAKAGADQANVEALQAQVKNAELNLAYTEIRAPRDGIISKALVRPGAVIKDSDTLLTTLYSVDPIYVTTTLSETQLLELSRRYGTLTTDSRKAPAFKVLLTDGTEHPHPARLNFVDAAVDRTTDTIEIRASTANAEGLLRPGQFVRLVLPHDLPDTSIRVPQRAVQELQGTRSVLVVGADNKVEQRQVEATYRVGNDWIITKGLSPGELIVTEGSAKARPGSVVKPVAADANAAAAAPAAPPDAKAAPAADTKGK
jgi:membrane fusion protein (multidrug efflux system)